MLSIFRGYANFLTNSDRCFNIIYISSNDFTLKLGSYAQFAPRVYFWPCERCFKNLHPGCKFAPTFEVVQIYLHPGANCAYERKMFIFYTF